MKLLGKYRQPVHTNPLINVKKVATGPSFFTFCAIICLLVDDSEARSYDDYSDKLSKSAWTPPNLIFSTYYDADIDLFDRINRAFSER